MDEKDILQFIAGKGDRNFRAKVVLWIKASRENQLYFNQLKAKQVAHFQSRTKIDIPVEWHRFMTRTKKHRMRYYGMTAAMITILLSLTTLLVTSKLEEGEQYMAYNTRSTEQKDFILPDGSKVTLNSESSLKIVPGFNDATRTVRLNGEAFFEVTHNKTRPFIVETQNGLKIKVLGTSFNVKAYKENAAVETTLVTGKVELYEKDSTTPSAILSPEQQAIFDPKKRNISVEQVSTSSITSWKEGILTFDNSPLLNVVKDIERWYGVSIQIISPELKSYSFSGKFLRKYSVEQVMNILKTSSPIYYTYDRKKNIISIEQRR
ncbi:FecR family protein [Sinomicrobium sp.]